MKLSNVLPFILVGVLSVLCAEVFAGSSQAWFIDSWGLIVVFPLYLSHLLFFLNVAFRTKRTTLLHLYFFGAIFALYESWITKVLWWGYPNTATQASTFFGIAYSEFSTLVFFWHPVMSFILPILIFEILTGRILKSHVIKKSNMKTLLLFVAAVTVAAYNTNGSQYNIILSNIAIIGSMLIILLLSKIIPKNVTIYSLKLSNNWFVILIIYIILLYSLTFFSLLPERIPSDIFPILLVLLIYLLFGLILKMSKPEEEQLVENKYGYTKKDLIKFAAVIIISSNIFCLVPVLAQVGILPIFLIMTLGAPVLLIRNVIKLFAKHLPSSGTNIKNLKKTKV